MESQLGSEELKTSLCQRVSECSSLEERNMSGATFLPLMFFNLDQTKAIIIKGSYTSYLLVHAQFDILFSCSASFVNPKRAIKKCLKKPSQSCGIPKNSRTVNSERCGLDLFFHSH
jgi:hypothetical protein